MREGELRLAESLRHRRGRVVVVTGAGISLASGIPTFRGTDPGAVWKQDVTELGTLHFFRQDPVGSWRWYLSRFDQVLEKHPNDAHRALAQLERWFEREGGELQVITQNVDTLHEDAGARSLIKVHGSADRVRCSRDGCRLGAPAGSLRRADIDFEPFCKRPGLATLPRCKDCGHFLRQHVLWFDEYYDSHRDYQWPAVMEAARRMQLLLFVGTSLAVGVTDLFVQAAAERGIAAFAIDPAADRAPSGNIELLQEKAELVLPRVAQMLGAIAAG